MSLSLRSRVRACGVILLAALPAVAADLTEGEAPPVPVPGSVAEVHECMDRNIPHKPLKQKVRFRAIDALGSECALRTFDYFKKVNDRNRAKLCVKEPLMMRGSNSLGIEASDPNRAADCHFYSPSLKRTRVCPRGSATDLRAPDAVSVSRGHFPRVAIRYQRYPQDPDPLLTDRVRLFALAHVRTITIPIVSYFKPRPQESPGESRSPAFDPEGAASPARRATW